MLEFLAALVGPGLVIGVGAAAATGAGGYVVGRRTAPRGVSTVYVRSDDTAVTSTGFHNHVHQWGTHREGEVHWRCVVPGCDEIGPRIPGAHRPVEG